MLLSISNPPTCAAIPRQAICSVLVAIVRTERSVKANSRLAIAVPRGHVLRVEKVGLEFGPLRHPGKANWNPSFSIRVVGTNVGRAHQRYP